MPTPSQACASNLQSIEAALDTVVTPYNATFIKDAFTESMTLEQFTEACEPLDLFTEEVHTAYRLMQAWYAICDFLP